MRKIIAVSVNAVLAAVAAFFFLVSCSAKQKAMVDLPDSLVSAALSIDVFSARGFLGGSEYERYFLSDGLLWRECGSVKLPGNRAGERKRGVERSIEGDEVFPRDTSLEISQRRVEKISADEEASLKMLASALGDVLAKGAAKRPPLPGSYFSLAEPGILELQVLLGEDKLRLVTSVDAIADGDSSVEKSSRALLERLRGIGPVICGAETFFGIGRRVAP